MRLSVVLTAHNKARYLEFLLKRMRAAVPDAELVLVDDGSGDGTGRIMQRYADRFARTENIWETRANNAALAMATGDFVAIVQDDDLMLATDWLRSCAAAMTRFGIAILSARGTGHWFFRAADPLSVAEGPDTIQYSDETMEYWCRPFAGGRHGVVRRVANIDKPVLPEGSVVTSGIYPCHTGVRSPFIITRELLEQVGRFDETYAPLMYDDHDLCMRATKAGYRVALTKIPQTCRFLGGSSWLTEDPARKKFLSETTSRNIGRFIDRHAESLSPFNGSPIVRIGSIVFHVDTALVAALGRRAASPTASAQAV